MDSPFSIQFISQEARASRKLHVRLADEKAPVGDARCHSEGMAISLDACLKPSAEVRGWDACGC
jgi:hypothetical protein